MLARKARDISPYIGPLTLLLGINAVELVPNATLTPITWLLSGALMGYAESLRRERLNMTTEATVRLKWRPVID